MNLPESRRSAAGTPWNKYGTVMGESEGTGASFGLSDRLAGYVDSVVEYCHRQVRNNAGYTLDGVGTLFEGDSGQICIGLPGMKRRYLTARDLAILTVTTIFEAVPLVPLGRIFFGDPPRDRGAPYLRQKLRRVVDLGLCSLVSGDGGGLYLPTRSGHDLVRHGIGTKRTPRYRERQGGISLYRQSVTAGYCLEHGYYDVVSHQAVRKTANWWKRMYDTALKDKAVLDYRLMWGTINKLRRMRNIPIPEGMYRDGGRTYIYIDQGQGEIRYQHLFRNLSQLYLECGLAVGAVDLVVATESRAAVIRRYVEKHGADMPAELSVRVYLPAETPELLPAFCG